MVTVGWDIVSVRMDDRGGQMTGMDSKEMMFTDSGWKEGAVPIA